MDTSTNPTHTFVQNLLPRHIRKLIKAKSATNTTAVHKEGTLYMDTAVSLWGTIGSETNFNNRPDAKALQLKEQLAQYAEVESNQICIGNGSTELVDLIVRTFCTPSEDSVLCFAPTSERFVHAAKMNALDVDVVELGPDFVFPIYEARKAIKETTKIIFIENPNHITGACCANFDIVDLVTSFEGIVVVDESAIDYNTKESLVSMVKTCSNVIVLQSFSRAWGLAGLPVGMAFADAEIIQVLDILKPAYSVNIAAQRAAVKALYVADQKDRVVTRTIEQREQVKTALEKLQVVKKVYPSLTNTLLIEVEDADLTTTHLLNEEQIVVKNVSHLPGLQNCIRISIGQSLDNVRLVKALNDMPSKTSGARFFWKTVSKTLRKASVFLGAFKKILGV